MTPAVRGDVVRVHYTTRSGDDCVLETSALREPIEFVAGDGEVIAGLSAAVIGMHAGERKRIHVAPEQGFGFRDPRLQQSAPRIAVPERASDGDQLTATVAGRPLAVWIRGFQGDEALLDANHPLAGEALVIDLELVGIGGGNREATA